MTATALKVAPKWSRLLIQARTEPAVARFLSRIAVRDDTGCLEWTAYARSNGYADTRYKGRRLGVHRLAYELLVGPIPEGLQLDHLCRVRLCVNPEHLEPVTCRENLLRGDTFQAANARKTHCKRGHLLDEANTLIDRRGQWRNCRKCATDRKRRWREQRRDARHAL